MSPRALKPLQPSATPPELIRTAFPTSGAGIQLRRGPHVGRLLQPYCGWFWADGRPGDQQVVRSYVLFSDDHGRTWQRGEPVGQDMDETTIVELSDGRVLLNSRDHARGGRRDLARGVHEQSGAVDLERVRDQQLSVEPRRVRPGGGDCRDGGVEGVAGEIEPDADVLPAAGVADEALGFEAGQQAQRLGVALEAAAVRGEVVERLFAVVAEGRVAHVVGEAGRLDEVGVAA